MVQLKALAWLAAVALAVAPSGCTASPEFEGPWAAEFESAYADATTDFQREVLADGQITRDEYAEATDRYVQCMDDRGFDVEISDNDGLNGYAFREEPGIEAASDECFVELIPIEALYGSTFGNPDNRPPSELYAECFVRHGFAEPGFTGADWDRWLSDNENADIVRTPSGQEINEDVQHCITDPAW